MERQFYETAKKTNRLADARQGGTQALRVNGLNQMGQRGKG